MFFSTFSSSLWHLSPVDECYGDVSPFEQSIATINVVRQRVNDLWTGSDLGVLAQKRAGGATPHGCPLGLCLLLLMAGAARRRSVGRNIEPCGRVNPWRFRPYTAHVSNGVEARVVVGQVKTRSTPFQLQFSPCLQLCPKVQKISDLRVGSAMRGLHSGQPFCPLGCI